MGGLETSRHLRYCDHGMIETFEGLCPNARSPRHNIDNFRLIVYRIKQEGAESELVVSGGSDDGRLGIDYMPISDQGNTYRLRRHSAVGQVER